MVCKGSLEELVRSNIADTELLYRSIKKNQTGVEFYRYDGQKLRISSSAFNDRSQQPSVDRSILQNSDPTKSKKSPTDGIAVLLTQEIREERVDIMSSNGKTIDTTKWMRNLTQSLIRLKLI